MRATVGVSWKGENRLVFDKKPVDVVEGFTQQLLQGEPEAVVVGEGGKIWAQARAVGGFMVAGQAGCVELQVKNHSTKKVSQHFTLHTCTETRICRILGSLCP